MSKLYETPARDTAQNLPETHEVLPELPDDVTVPDDLSGITHPVKTDGGRAASGIRWMRWVPAVLLLVAGAVALGLALRGDGTTTASESTPEIVWVPSATPTVGPGSNSLDAVPMPVPIRYERPTVGPGSNSLDAVPMPVPIRYERPTVGPGSNSLDASPMPALPTPWTTPTEGPGSNSLAP